MAILTYDDAALLFGSDASGCPEPVLARHVKNVVNELCTTAQVYRVTLPVVTQKGVDTYPLAVPLDTRLEAVKFVIYDERQLQFVPDEKTYRRTDGHPVFYGVTNDAQLKLVPVPVEDGKQLICEVAVKPRFTATGVDEALLDMYFDAVYHGTLSRVFAMSDEAWYDPRRAAEHYASYSQFTIEAQRKAAGKKQSRQRVSKFQW